GGSALEALADGTKTIVDGLALAEHATAITAQARRLRLIAFVHGPLALEIGLPPAAAMRAVKVEARLLSRVRGIICPSNRTAAAIEGYGIPRERIAAIPPGTARPSGLPRPRRWPVRALLCVANLVPRKGHRVLVRALSRIRDLEWSLTCVGSLTRHPPTVRAVRRAIAVSGLGDRVRLVGERPPRSVAQAYRKADAFVLPSFHEGYGMVYAEAMTYGLPVIATTAGAIPETVPAGAGVLVPPGDEPGLARALRRLIREPLLAAGLAKASHAAGARLRDWRQTMEAWETAFDHLADLDRPL
ncbi:MAG: glycosyltransferase family 4 protein, partial [Alphaproteobacteria bacterium]|nr:glycosyltransferase family 4 protein [Alphaproteobacteria bacterium]